LKLLKIWKTEMRISGIGRIGNIIMRKTAERRPAGLADRYAHRGFHDKPVIPENSMAAFRRAVEHGFPSEFDVHLIADGSLVVFHDEDLKRETGVKGQIEDYDLTDLRKLRLEGTDECIPTLDEVLDLYEDTGLPLLIELKVARGNYRELTEAACRRLDRYTGEFVIESFDPRVLMVLAKIRPGFARGQLAQNFLRHRGRLPRYQAVLLTNLMMNFLSKPDFIAYRFEDRWSLCNAICTRLLGIKGASWTLHSARELRKAREEGLWPIFENFDPATGKRFEDAVDT
jgi:glycerophosphoryl diester phosphodiesterase